MKGAPGGARRPPYPDLYPAVMSHDSLLIPLIRRLAASAIAALCALAITVGVMSYLTWQSMLWVRHTNRVQAAGTRTLDLALNREASVNEYLIANDTAVLVMDRQAKPAITRALDTLRLLTADNPGQQARLADIRAAVREWDRSYVERILHARDSAERVRIGHEQRAGTAAFSRVRTSIESFLDAEAVLHARRSQRNSMWRAAEILLVGFESFVILAVLVYMRRELLTHAGRALEQQNQLEEQAVELEAQAAEQEMLTADLQVANQELTDAGMEQEALTADLELANHELIEAARAAESARDMAVRLEERYRVLFESNPVPLWVFDEETLRFLAVNKAAIAQYGYSAEEFLSMTIEQVRPAEDLPKLRAALAMMTPELLHSRGWRHLRKDGSEIQTESLSNRIEFEGRPACIVLSMDVTERMAAEAALEESNTILGAVVDDSPLAIVIAEADLTITRWNDAAVKQFGWTAEEAIGQSLMMLIPEDRRQEFLEQRRRLEHGAIVTNFETQRIRRDGTVRDVNISKCALYKGGKLNGLVSIISDSTDRKRLEAQYRQAQKMEAVGQLAGGVAHDFNNLLTVIISYSQMLLADIAEDGTARADVMEIKRAAERAALLTKQLLAFSRQQVLRPQNLDLNLVIGQLEQMLRRLLREDISIVLTLDPELGAVAADPGQIEQIVMNLVVNARDAMPNGGRLSIETRNVSFDSPYQVRASEAQLDAGAYVVIAVSDNGTGMSAQVQARIFEPFFTTKRMNEGTGLGLSTVYGIVKQSGGYITVYSEIGHGTTFKIYLPRVDSVIDATAADDSATMHTTRGGETVLIVEDDDALRTVACRALQQCGYEVLVASNGSEALEQCSRHEGGLHLVVTDMVMPEMSGIELAESIALSYPEIKVLLMSGYTRDETARRGIASERYAFLEKPFTPAKLASRVRELLDGRTRVGMQIA
jgi:two-component system, cell cycle sensor histidine kinase and response regulator CckA